MCKSTGISIDIALMSRSVCSEELRKVHKLIFNEKASNDDKIAAHQTLLVWKARRCDETPSGVLCTLALLDVHLKVKILVNY
jgi:hypothetical protein